MRITKLHCPRIAAFLFGGHTFSNRARIIYEIRRTRVRFAFPHRRYVTASTAWARFVARTAVLLQYTTSCRAFEYTEHALIISYVSPLTGPSHGGTTLVVHAAGLRLGAHYCCRLSAHNESLAANHDSHAIVFRAVFQPAGGFRRLPWPRVCQGGVRT